MQLSFDDPELLRAYFFALLESLAAGILIADGAGNLQAVNAKAAELLGLAGSSVMQRPCWQVLTQFLHLDGEAIARLQHAGGGIVFERGEQDDTKVMLCITRSEMRSPFRELGGSFFLRIEDISRKAMVEEQQERQRRLTAMQEMALDLNQELKNPLGSIELYASLLKRELADDPDNCRLAAQILHAVRTMDSLLHNCLTYSSLPEPRMERIVVKQWLKEVVAKLRQMDSRKLFHLRLAVELGQQEVFGDRKLLDLLAVQSALNAMESMNGGGEIEIRCQLASDAKGSEFFAIRVIDGGSGIAPQHLGRIFDPFFSTKKFAAGMGLPVIHFIAEAHHGFVRIESEEGRGTTLTVLLPTLDRAFNSKFSS